MSTDKNELIEAEKEENMLTNYAPHLVPAEAGEGMVGIEATADLQQVAYMKIVQSQAKPELKEQFDEGSAIITPQMIEIIQRSESFLLVPIFSYNEYTLQNPIGSNLPFIQERTFDPNSEIAQRAKSRKKEDWQVPMEDNPTLIQNYVHHLNFVIVLETQNESIGVSPIVVSFFKSEWKKGLSFNSLIKARRNRCKFSYGCRFQAGISLRRNDRGSWYGFDIFNPESDATTEKELFEAAFVTDPGNFDMYREMHEGIKASFEDAGLNVNYDHELNTVDASVVEAATEKY